MIEVPVMLGERSYPVIVGHGLLPSAGARVRARLPDVRGCAVVTDANVGPRYAGAVVDSLREAGIASTVVTVPAGEPSKSMGHVEEVCRQMIRAGLDRSSLVVALGGGVVGDLAGFCAAIFLRGIPHVQIPTTVVSVVDSAVGGKTGVNAPEGKNLLGAFHQPSLVLADVDTLASLPTREFNEGFAEVIKHAAIADAAMLPLIARARDDRSVLAELIARNVAIKARIVAEDENETSGRRALLNFGHTVGHAIEASAGYGSLLHGEAISLGLIAALELSTAVTGLAPEAAAEVVALLRKFGLPQHLSRAIETPAVMEKLSHDKKFSSGQIRFVLLRSLGDAIVSCDVTVAQIEAAVESLRGEAASPTAADHP